MTDRLSMLHQWLRVDLDMKSYDLACASEDASFRRYYRVVSDGDSHIVMDAPPDKEDCRAFLDVTERLLRSGINVPIVYAQDLQKGFLLLSDLGRSLYLDKLCDENADALYTDAIRSLVKMQIHAPLNNLPSYSESLLMQEMCLFRDWLLERHCQISLNTTEQSQLNEVFQLLSESATKQAQVFVHRDFHSRNLILNDRNPGVIDYQDAVTGPVSYDLVSLLKDCYIKWPLSKVDRWVQLYLEFLAEASDLQIGKDEFKRHFDLMGVQRHLKASGIFARLNHRDGKPDYLKDIPRTLSYIVDLSNDYPELKNLIALLQGKVIPGLGRA
ncbi:MAG: aminoglycoside/choline kinase family phosphotransferase [Gammaproteobacteria bacterium]|jgi:aminoglycoside/choline kinase family phosphotransferase